MAEVFVDTSAMLALLVPSDSSHSAATQIFERLKARTADLITTSYVLLETYALLGRRHGPAMVGSFREGFAPLLDIIWVDPLLHERVLDLLLERSIRDLSLVDTVSFVAIRDHRIESVFAFDGHFDDEARVIALHHRREGGGMIYELVTRDGCHLCDEMAAVLDDVLPGYGLSWSPRDVDAEPELRTRFTDAVPVLLRDGQPVAKVRLDRRSLVRIVEGRR